MRPSERTTNIRNENNHSKLFKANTNANANANAKANAKANNQTMNESLSALPIRSEESSSRRIPKYGSANLW